MKKKDIEAFCIGEKLYYNNDEQKESFPFVIMNVETERLIGRVMNEGITIICDSDESMANVAFDAKYPVKEGIYRFHRNDCVIALGHKNIDEDVYARVLKVDVREGTVTLEKYHKQGKKYLGDFIHNLEELQSKALYVPMTKEERKTFGTNMVRDHKKITYVSNGKGKMILKKEE